MWKIKHIFDGDYGCEETGSGEPMVSVTIVDENGAERWETVPDAWLTHEHLDVGSEWPDHSDLSIETRDLILRKAAQPDWRSIWENLWRHEESAKYMLWDVTRTEREAAARMQRTVRFQKYHKYVFLVIEKITGEAIGFAGMTEVEPGVYEDTGLALGPAYTGRGYGRQVLTALAEAAAAEGARKMVTSCRKQNAASRNLQTGCGFVFSHEEDRTDPRNGQPYILEFYEKELQA